MFLERADLVGDIIMFVTSPVSLRLREAEHWVECLEVVLSMREKEIDVSEGWQRLLVSCCKRVEKKLGTMEDSQDILRVAGARGRVGLYEAMEALFDERRLVDTEAGGMNFWMAYRELEEGVGLMEEGVGLMDQFLGKDAGEEGREGWGRMARREVYSEVEHLVIGLNRYGEGRGR